MTRPFMAKIADDGMVRLEYHKVGAIREFADDGLPEGVRVVRFFHARGSGMLYLPTTPFPADRLDTEIANLVKQGFVVTEIASLSRSG